MVNHPKYNIIGLGYNSTRQADPYLLSRLHDLLEPKASHLYLDIGCGTGNYTVALANKGVDLIGIDPSEIMLQEGKLKSDKIKWHLGNAENIPLENNYFNGAIATLTLHHWQNLEKGFTELARVLKPKSKVVIFSSTPEQMQGYWLNHYFPNILSGSTQTMPSLETVENASAKAGFKLKLTENYFVADDLKDLFLHSGKNNPELYFNENIRNGISTFASSANKKEVDKGLQMLRKDIDSGKFENIKKKYDNQIGDYIFIVLEK